MLLGKYGAKVGLPWWVYYPVPMFMTVLQPPFILKFDRPKTILYLAMSVVGAPQIHESFSFLLERILSAIQDQKHLVRKL